MGVPHKEVALTLCDHVSEEAQRVGAVNTIIVEDGKLFGSNADIHGAATALAAHTDLNGKKVVVLGAGGSAKALCCLLINSGSKVTLLNRTPERAARLKESFPDISIDSIEKFSHHLDYDILVDATSVGFF